MKLFYLLFLGFILPLGVAAQSAKFYAQSDAKKIVLGSYVDVEFILENVDGNNFNPPPFKDFDIISGPNRSSSMSIVNGKVSKKLGYGYSLKPKRIGTFTIGSASIQTNQTTVKTNTLVLEVVKGAEITNDAQEDVFIQTILSDSISYIGHQIVLEYKLFTKVDVRSVNFSSEQDFEGFYTENVRTTSEKTNREIIEGVEYATKVIKRICLFPQQKGNYTIEPVAIDLGIANKNSNRGFFFSSQLTAKRVLAKGAEITVRNTPPTSDLSFSGAVGKYEMNASIAKRSITTDEAIVLMVQVVGDGDNKTVQAPRWELPEALDVYDPNIIEDEVFKGEGKIRHRKTFEYLIVPKSPGKYYINPEFTYFDTDSQKYVKLVKNLPAVNVLKGTQTTKIVQPDKAEKLAGNIPHTTLYKKGQQIHGSPLYVSFLVLGLIGICALIFYSNYLEKSGRRDPLMLKRQKALQLAMSRLQNAAQLKEKQDNKAFYEEITVAIKKFITDKFGIPAMHINKNDIVSSLNDKAIEKGIVDTFENILNNCEMALYAPSMASNPEELYQQALQLFTNLEN